jgi:class 3 adenylate cyclase
MQRSIVATILFADLMNSTEMAKNLTLQEYDEMIVDFQGTMYEVVAHHLNHYGYEGSGVDYDWSIVGDQLQVFLYSDSVRFDVRSALLIAAKIKLAWLAAAFNQRILQEGRLVSRIGIGINCGKVIKDLREWRMKMGEERPTIEGYAINLAKRIESASREGTVHQIMVGASFYQRCQDIKTINIAFSQPWSLGFKGISQKIPVYEVVSFVNFEILSSMPSSLQNGLIQKIEYALTQPMPEPWLFITLLRHYVSLLASVKHDNLETLALECAQQALELLDYKPVIYNIIGWLYTYGQSIRDLEMAIHYFDRSLALEPNNAAALLHKARALELSGKKDLSHHAYEEVLFHNHDHREARRMLPVYRAGKR